MCLIVCFETIKVYFFYSNLERGIKNDFINQEFWKIC